jgi:hypothetical protein
MLQRQVVKTRRTMDLARVRYSVSGWVFGVCRSFDPE